MALKREEYIRSIRQKDIILFGAGNYAKRFYNMFKDELHIKGCITNNSQEKVFQVNGKEICPVLRPECLAGRREMFIILCAACHMPMGEQLRAMGFNPGADYIDSDMFQILYSGKKIALFYGVCYVRAIYTCLQHSEKFTSVYESFYWMEYLKMDALEDALFSCLLGMCDLFIYSAYLTPEKRRISSAYLSRLDQRCIPVSIPLLFFQGYYPCVSGLSGMDNRYSVVSNASPYAPFLTPDHNVNRMMEEGTGLAEIIKRAADPDFYQKEFVVGYYTREMRKLELAETAADIRICDYLYENHGKKRTFLNEKHISNPVIRELAHRVMDRLEMERDIGRKVLEERLLYTSEVPVYPSVIKHLSLDVYRGEYTLYTFKGDVRLTFEEYISRYYEYCVMMKRCFEYGYFPFSEGGPGEKKDDCQL